MNLAIKSTKKPEEKVRLALRGGRWKGALAHFEEQAKADEQDSAKWNILGDMQYRASDTAAAASSWRHALDGYMHDGLHENALGVARKIARILPDETAVHLSISDAYIGLEYFADAIGAFRSYVKLNKTASFSEKKTWFRRIMNCEIHQPHLLEEISHILSECGVEDIELERDVKQYTDRMNESNDVYTAPLEEPSFEPAFESVSTSTPESNDGLVTIDGGWAQPMSGTNSGAFQPVHSMEPSFESVAAHTEYEIPAEATEEMMPDGQGKDHYDLGVVYAEMKLWDAAITEFQTARRDKSIRGRATLELAQCYKNSNDPHRALKLLEEESALGTYEAGVQDDLCYQMGLIHEIIGNNMEALESYEKVGDESAHSIDAIRRASSIRTQL